MKHVVLLGDSIFDNAAYVEGGPDVLAQLKGGPARLEIEGRGAWPLSRGDVFYVKAGLRHRAVNLGRRPLKQITVWYPPKY